MANRRRGEVDIALDRRRTLRYDFYSMAMLEQKLGTKFLHLMNQVRGAREQSGDDEVRATAILIEKIGFHEAIHFLWAGLLHADRNLTVESAAELMEKTLHSDLSEDDEPPSGSEQLGYVLGTTIQALLLFLASETEKKMAGAERALGTPATAGSSTGQH